MVTPPGLCSVTSCAPRAEGRAYINNSWKTLTRSNVPVIESAPDSKFASKAGPVTFGWPG